MILNRKDWELLMPHSFQSLVIEVNLSGFDLVRIEGMDVNTEPMVLGGDGHLTGLEIFDRLIGSPMSKLQFKCPPSECQPQKLVAQANPEDGFFSDKLADRFNDIWDSFRVTRPIG